MAKRNQSARKTTPSKKPRRRQTLVEPTAQDLVHHAHVTSFAQLRFDCEMFLQITHPDFLPHEVMALVKQGQAQLLPVAPGQVGTLVLEGFPYTVLGYYTFLEQDSSYELSPDDCSFHGPFYDFYQDQKDTIQAMVNATADEFEQVRQVTQKMREDMAARTAAQPKRKPARRK